jgi:hypothetical protein
MIDKRILRLAVLGGLAFSLPVHAQYSSPIRDVDNGATGASHVIPMVKLTNTSFGSDFIGGNGALRMYADAGSTVTVTYERGGTTGAESIGMNITGHYVNLP